MLASTTENGAADFGVGALCGGRNRDGDGAEGSTDEKAHELGMEIGYV